MYILVNLPNKAEMIPKSPQTLPKHFWMGFLMMIKALPSLKLVPVLKKVEVHPKSFLEF
jgi:hypothetical protein